jgi:acyl-CoA synthetase (AMP-forming)/AMP-acid ligase II
MTNISANIRALEYRDSDSTLIVLPLCHGYGLVHQALCHLAIGATVVLPPAPLVAPVLVKWLKLAGTTTLATAPPILPIFVEGLRRTNLSLPELRLITIGTARADAAWIHEVHRLLPHAKIAITYGLTEAGPRVSAGFVNNEAFDPGCVGSPLPNVEIICGRESTEIAAEIVVRGRSVMRNFSSEAFAEGTDCCIRTADVGRVREGALHLIGRKSRSINRGGVLVAPENIEKALLMHPCVESVRVDAESDPFWGEVPVAEVRLHDNASVVDEGALLQFCKDRLSAEERPVRISVCRADRRFFTRKETQMAALFDQ